MWLVNPDDFTLAFLGFMCTLNAACHLRWRSSDYKFLSPLNSKYSLTLR